MRKIFALLLVFSITVLYSQQALREKPDATDGLEFNPLNGLHYIELSVEKDVFDQKGITDKKATDNYYFRVEGEEDYTKVSYFGNNLSDYVTNVEPAYDIMADYRNLKLAHAGLFWGGMAMAAAGAALSLLSKDISPVIFVGIGSFSSSWIPNHFSHDKIPEAVGIYNQSVGKYQVSNSTGPLTP